MGLKRREFLQQSGWLLAGLGISEALLWQMSDRYAQALAQPTTRKLALLIGINQYRPLETDSPPLRGAITDVELQRELLTYRFGFQPSDILTLTDSQATRKNIEAAFQSHLQEQAKGGDIVVFHFSGFGSRISLDESLEKVQNSLVPVDDILPTESAPIANDLLEETLLMLLRSLNTENAIACLDASYTDCGADFQGNLRIRCRARPTAPKISAAELAVLTGLKANSNLDFTRNYRKNQALVPAQLAAEIEHNGFNAGVFTYALTQSLWHTTDAANLQICLSQAIASISKLTEKNNCLEIPAANSQIKEFPSKFSGLITNSQAADGVAIAIEDSGKTAQLWLGGLPAKILDTYQDNSLFTLIPETIPRLQLRSRNGLIAKAQIKEISSITDGNFVTPVVGQLVREAVRILPRNISLKVALDPALERIERVDATSAFSLIPQVSVVTGEQVADYRFGHVSQTAIAQMPNTSLPLYQGRYGLFSVGQKLIPNTVGEGGAAVKIAVQSLAPQLKTLLAAKLLGLTANVESSLLKVKATLALIPPANNASKPESQVLIEQAPLSAFEQDKSNISSPFQPNTDGIVNLPVGTRIQYKLYNESERPVYFMVFCLDSKGLAIVFNPPSSPTATNDTSPDLSSAAEIAPQPTLNQPINPHKTTTKHTLEWLIHGSSGLVETHILFSQSPFTQTLAALAGEMQQVRDNLSIAILLNPLKVTQAVLQDLHNASIKGVQKVGLVTEDFALDVNAWANLSFVYRVI